MQKSSENFKHQMSKMKKKEFEVQQNVNFLHDAKDSVRERSSLMRKQEMSERTSSQQYFSEARSDVQQTHAGAQEIFPESQKN